MYVFRDTVASDAEERRLPAEAVKWNGEWFDFVIPGFRTLNVTGREAYGRTVNSHAVVRDDFFDSSKYEPRDIKVRYAVFARNPLEFRKIFNLLNQKLAVDEAELVFNDEKDKYFIATPMEAEDVQEGRNKVTGVITFRCTDPRKYSVRTREFAAKMYSGNILKARVTNAGNVPVPINYRIANPSENGYVGIVSKDGAIQLGYPEDVDHSDPEWAMKLLTFDDIINATDDIGGTNYLFPDHTTNGTMKTTTAYGTTWLVQNTAATTTGKWNDALRTLTVLGPVGYTGARNFFCQMRFWFGFDGIGQQGMMTVAFLTVDNKVIAGISIAKSSVTDSNMYLTMHSQGKTLKSVRMPNVIFNTRTLAPILGSSLSVTKEDDKLIFEYASSPNGNADKYSFVVPEDGECRCKKIQFALSRYGDGDSKMAHNALSVIDYADLNNQDWKNVPNRYSVGDVIEIDGSRSKVSVNGVPRPTDEVVGSKYSKVEPGTTEIEFANSTWAAQPIEVIATIREAWI